MPLPDGRVLLVGGTVYNNVDNETEIYDPKKKCSSPTPGFEKQLARQEKALKKHRTKEKRDELR